MKIKTIILAMVAALATVAANIATADSLPSTYAGAKAKHAWDRATLPGASMFQSQELSLDVGSTYTTPASTTIFEQGGGKGVWGLDLGADYWFKRCAALGLDTGVVNTKQRNDLLVSHLDARFSLREPLDLLGLNSAFLAHFAPMESAGFGSDFEDGAYEFTLRAALVARITPMIGVNGGYQRTFENGRNNDKGQWVFDFEISF